MRLADASRKHAKKRPVTRRAKSMAEKRKYRPATSEASVGRRVRAQRGVRTKANQSARGR